MDGQRLMKGYMTWQQKGCCYMLEHHQRKNTASWAYLILIRNLDSKFLLNISTKTENKGQIQIKLMC